MRKIKLYKMVAVLVVASAFNTNIYAISKHSFQLVGATISTIHKALKDRQISCEQLIRMYLARIKKYDLDVTNGAPLNAIVNINPFVLNQARHLDSIYRQTHKLVGALYCIPVIVKDNIDTYDSNSTSGSLALLGNQPVKDAFLVTKLRKAGAIILGKGAMDEFASGMVGISSRSGRVGNTYDSFKNPGGSSGGPAVAVSANFTMVAIGTDNSGSLRIPAAFNGISGLRPSYGLISQNGIFPGGSLDGTAGPLARTVEDLAAVLTVIAKQARSYMPYLQKNGLVGKRIGLLRSAAGISSYRSTSKDVMRIYKSALSKMKKAGAIIIDNIRLPNFNPNRKYNMAGDVAKINKYLSLFPATRQNVNDICLSNRTRTYGNVKDCLHFFARIPNKNSTAYRKTIKMFSKNRKYVESIMKKYHLDALFMPISSSGSATYDVFSVNTWKIPVSSNSGLPAITLIAGYHNKMPVGVELIGKYLTEPTLLAMAYAYEKNTKPRLIPKLKQPKGKLILESCSTPQLNNLFTLIGEASYKKVLKNGKESDLTPGLFKRIVANVLNSNAKASFSISHSN